MELEKLSFEETKKFSSLFLDYLKQKETLAPFYNEFADLNGLKKIIDGRSFPTERREVLVNSLTNQYNELAVSDQVKTNIDLLKDEKTFTVTTGHQLNIFTGPLYYIYKLVTVVNATKELKKVYPDYNFVPVYWMATEDHDFEEINHFNLFGKRYTWNTEQKGAVGRFETESIAQLFEELPEELPLFKEAYESASNLADAVRRYVNTLFGDQGLVVIDADDQALKSIFAPVISDELANHNAKSLAERDTKQLEELSYKSQVFPREINFFYLKGNIRERIVREGEQYQVLNTDLVFTAAEIQQMVKDEPEVFSPNVILRPLYQETILPNIAYVGGPSELVYWLQLKGIFDHFKTPFPALMPRNFALVINNASKKKLDKIGLPIEKFFFDSHSLKSHYLEGAAENEFDLDKEKSQITDFFETLKKKAAAIDGSLEGFIGAESSKAIKSLDNIEKRLKKSEERKHETALNQINGVKEKLFPENGLQERHDNFLNFYLNNPEFIDQLIGSFEPFDYRFNILKG